MSNNFRFFLKASKKQDIEFLLGILLDSSPWRSFQTYLYSHFFIFFFMSETKNKNALDFLKSQLEQIRVVTIFSVNILRNATKKI